MVSEDPAALKDYQPAQGLPRIARCIDHTVYHGGLAGVGKDAEGNGTNTFRIRYDDGDYDDLSIEEFIEAAAMSKRICADKG